jgi:ubiquinone/menaquinone biosynthesis C-methylase UbiE
MDMRGGHDEITDIIRHHWDRRASAFDDEGGHGLVSEQQRLAWLDLLSRLAGPAPRRVLDVGCGTGFLALRFAELGHTVTAIDLSPKMLDRARRRAEEANYQIDFRVANAVALDSPDATYDLVVARHVIWNLAEPGRGVAEWLRVLRPGGRLALIEGQWANNEALARHYRRPTSRLLARVIETGAALLAKGGASDRRYHRIELQLPFSGGPTEQRLTAFLRARGLHDVEVEPLMDPILWGEAPQFPRYLVIGSRSPVTEVRS